jgi:hypothetical protein
MRRGTVDGQRFDRLARRLSGGSATRRWITWALVSGVVTGLLGRVDGTQLGGEASAGCKRSGGRCERSGDCCKGGRCRNRKCVCKSNHEDCDGDGRCENLLNDLAHCGECNNLCRFGGVCCDGGCALLDSNENNCGACGNACAAGELCCTGVCTDTATSNDHCGACDNPCFQPTELCDGGQCAIRVASPCSPQDDRCVGSSTCTGVLNGQQVCCGPSGTACTAGAAAFCCSGQCGNNQTCV